MNKRRLPALLALLAMLACLCPVPARASGSVYFTAAGSYVLPLSDSTMPFWTGGYLYIPTTVFTGSAREALGISQVLNNAQNRVVLYSGGRSLTYELGNGHARDNDGVTYYPGAVRRNGVVFVPAYSVSRCFDIVYSVIDVNRGSLVWLRQPDYTLSDSLYADAARPTMESVYAEYLRAKEQASPPAASSPPASSGDKPAPPPEPAATELDGKRVFLCLEGGKDSGALLEALDSYGVQAAFFFPPQEMESSGDLLRRMTAEGHSVGLLLDGTEGLLEEQMEAGNRALAQATCRKTRLAVLQDGRDGQPLRDMGVLCLRPDLDRSSQPLRTSAQAETLLQRISLSSGDTAVWLGGAASAGGLRALLSAVEEAGGVCQALTETSQRG